MSLQISRRAALASAASAAGLFVLPVVFTASATAAGGAGAARGLPTELGAWIEVHPDEAVVIRVAKSEMGQGVLTSMAMLVAEELDCDWSRVRTEGASAARARRESGVYGRMRTGGSSSVRGSQEALRRAGATAKAMLLAAAARQWDVPIGELSVRDGIISHLSTARRTTYGAVASAATDQAPPSNVPLKDPREWRLLGRPVARLDTPAKVTGAAVYGIDVRLPGMLHAAVAICPVPGGSLVGFDAGAVTGMKGVQSVLRVDGATVAVLAETWWQAKTALEALPIRWNEGPNAGASSEAFLRDFRAALDGGDSVVVRDDGDARRALASAAGVVEAEYSAPYLSHAQLEPVNCTAVVRRDGSVEVWTPTQDPTQAIDAAAAAADVDPSRVEVNVTLLGGAFGRRLSQDYVSMAVTIARQVVDRPVKMLWSREDDMRHGLYRPMGVVRMRAALDGQGRITAWHDRVASHGIIADLAPQALRGGVDRSSVEGLDELPYATSSRRLELALRRTPLRPFFWRSVGHSQNAFFVESFVDELAQAAGMDPVAFRRRLLSGHPRFLAVLDAAAEHAGWAAPPQPGRHRGVAIHEAYGSVCAQVAEISIEGDARLRVHRITAALDCGPVVNPDTVRAQVEGAVMDGLSAALYGEITVENGRVVQGNYDSYEFLRLAEAPAVEVVLMPSTSEWGGVGEPALPPVAPAVCNAIRAATGVRIRSLPLKNHVLRMG